MSEGKIGAIDGDKLAAYLKTSVDLSKQWSSESDYKRGLKDERLRILDRILEHILTGTFALTAPPRDLTPWLEEKLDMAFKLFNKSTTDKGRSYWNGYSQALDDFQKFSKANEAQKESGG